MGKIVSFDILDTLLTRAVGTPEAAFLLLGQRLSQAGLVDCTAEMFARARVDAESRAYRNHGPGCTLEVIYAELSATLLHPSVDRQQLVDLELALEELLLHPLPDAAQRIDRARSDGFKVVFLSDVYLDTMFIRRQLERFGLWHPGDRCYLSSDSGKSKQTGDLFVEMLREEKAAPQEVVHEGNSPEHDVIPARKLGLQVRPYLGAGLNRYEHLLEEQAYATEGLSSVLSGASRLARLQTPASSAAEAALRDVAAGVVAPTVTSFALWILKRAQTMGLQRLYFIARDGQFLLETAQRLAQVLGLTVELRYLYGSRQAWNLPAIRHGTPEEMAWIWDDTDFLSVRSLLARVDIGPETVGQELLAAGFAPHDWDRSLSGAERARLKLQSEATALKALIVQRAAEKRRVLLRYLEQEGVMDPVPWGIVDLGWFGSMQNAISAVISEAGGQAPTGFYFALLQGRITDRYPANREAYYFDERINQGFLGRVPDLIMLMEMFFTADHGTVVDFGEQDGQVQPILKERWNQPAIDWGLPLLRETVACFVNQLVLEPGWVNPWVDLREAVTAVLRAFWLSPTKAEALAWSGFPWEDGLGLETTRRPLAQAFGWKDVVRLIWNGKIIMRHRAAWFAGSLVLSPAWVSQAMNFLDAVYRRLRQLRHHAKAGARDFTLAIKRRLNRTPD